MQWVFGRLLWTRSDWKSARRAADNVLRGYCPKCPIFSPNKLFEEFIKPSNWSMYVKILAKLEVYFCYKHILVAPIQVT